MGQVNIRTDTRNILGGYNVGTISYYTSVYPYIDLMKSSYINWFGGTLTASVDGWLYGINAAAGTQTTIVWQKSQTIDATQFNKIKLGNYKMTWTGGATVSVRANASLTTNTPNNTGTYLFSVNDNNDGVEIDVDVSNSSGSVDLTDLKIFHTDYEPLMPGQVFTPEFLDALAGASVVRMMEPQNINSWEWAGANPATIVYADYCIESDRCWAATPASATTTLRSNIPFTVLGKLGTELGKNIWVNCPAKATDACMASLASDLASTYLSGTVYAEASNETWNNGFTALSWLRDTYSATITVTNSSGTTSPINDTDKIACSYADISARWWKALETAFGASRIVRVMATQTGVTNWAATFYEYTPPVYGSKIKDLLNNSRGRLALAPYIHVAATSTFTSISGNANTDTKWMCENSAWTFTNAQWAEAAIAYINSIESQISDAQTLMLSKAPACRMSMYEGGNEFSYGKFENVDPPPIYSMTVDTGGGGTTNTLHCASSLVSGWTDAQAMWLDFNSLANQPNFPAARIVYVKLNGTNNLELYSDAGLTSRITLVADANTYTMSNYTRCNLVSAAARTFWDSTYASTVLDTMNTILIKYGFDIHMIFTNTGGWIPGYGFAFGSKPTVHDSDTGHERVLWFKRKFA